MNRAYWEHHAINGEELEVLYKPCADCAIISGFYKTYADDLINHADLIDAVKKRWYCHNHCEKACRGLWDYLKTGCGSETRNRN